MKIEEFERICILAYKKFLLEKLKKVMKKMGEESGT